MNDESSEKKDQPSKEASAFLEGLYGDPLRTETMRTGRHLIIASAICAVVVLFNVRLQGTGLVPLDFGNRTDVLPMLLSLAVILLLVSFALRASTDLLREWETARLVIEYIEAERVEAAARSARQTDEQMAEGQREEYEGPYDPDPWWKQYYEVKNAADEAVRKAEERLGIRRLPRHLRRVRTILEAGVPIGFAVIAIILSRTSIFAFFQSIGLGVLALVAWSDDFWSKSRAVRCASPYMPAVLLFRFERGAVQPNHDHINRSPVCAKVDDLIKVGRPPSRRPVELQQPQPQRQCVSFRQFAPRAPFGSWYRSAFNGQAAASDRVLDDSKPLAADAGFAHTVPDRFQVSLASELLGQSADEFEKYVITCGDRCERESVDSAI